MYALTFFSLTHFIKSQVKSNIMTLFYLKYSLFVFYSTKFTWNRDRNLIISDKKHLKIAFKIRINFVKIRINFVKIRIKFVRNLKCEYYSPENIQIIWIFYKITHMYASYARDKPAVR
jgi:hypothetical protein